MYINAFTFGLIGLGLGIAPAINHYLAAGKLDKSKLISQLLIFSFLASVFFIVLWYVVEPFGVQKIALPQVVGTSFIIFCLGGHLFLLLLNQLLSSVLLSQKMYARSASISVIGAVFLLAIYTYLHFFSKPVTESAFIFIVLANLLVLLVQSVLYIKGILAVKGFKFVFAWFDLSMIRLLFAFALLAYLTNFLQFLNYKMDVWFINSYVEDKSQLGIYGVAVSLSQLIWLLPNAFHSVLFTAVSENNSTETIKGQIDKWSKNVFYLAIGLGILGYFLSIKLLPTLFSAEYSSVVDVLPFLLPGIVLFAPSILWSAYFAGKGQVIVNLKATVLGFCAALVGGFFIIPNYGIQGAAIVTSVSYAFTAAYTYYWFKMK